MSLLIRGGILHDAIHPTPFAADILIRDGRIAAIAPDMTVSADTEIYDAAGLDIYPGFIDVHAHLGMFGTAGAETKDDVESSALVAPEQRGLDAVNPLEFTFQNAYEAGVTCVCTGPGSVSAIGGTHVALKTYGYRVADMVVRNPVAMKAAIGANPKSHQKSVSTRMTVIAAIRDTLYRAKEYLAKKERAAACGSDAPAYNSGLEALIPVLKKEIPLKVHGYRVDDLQAILRVAEELDIRLTLEHATDAFMLTDELLNADIPVAVGPYFGQPRRSELVNKSPARAVEMIRAGVRVSVMTDAPAVAIEYLPLSAGLLMREGLDEFEALKTITANAARHLGIEGRVGTLAVGLDADLVLARGCPMQMTVKPEAVFIDGRCVFSR